MYTVQTQINYLHIAVDLIDISFRFVCYYKKFGNKLVKLNYKLLNYKELSKTDLVIF